MNLVLLGENIDNTLSNHKFIQLQRYLLDIKGKAKKAPNPFKGKHTIKDNPDQKVIFTVDETDQFSPYILPVISEERNDSILNSFSIRIDKKDEKDLDKIIDKVLQRNGLNRTNIISSTKNEHESKPWIEMKLDFDIIDLRQGCLKLLMNLQ